MASTHAHPKANYLLPTVISMKTPLFATSENSICDSRSELGKPPMGTLVAAHANPLQVAVETADQPPLNIAAKPGVSVNTMALSSVPHSIDAETLGISTGITTAQAFAIWRRWDDTEVLLKGPVQPNFKMKRRIFVKTVHDNAHLSSAATSILKTRSSVKDEARMVRENSHFESREECPDVEEATRENARSTHQAVRATQNKAAPQALTGTAKKNAKKLRVRAMARRQAAAVQSQCAIQPPLPIPRMLQKVAQSEPITAFLKHHMRFIDWKGESSRNEFHPIW
ncbi:hypothetical protein B0H14DRAFT_2598238 [Mycena olivaceomarginata]|nr:hypothetical protein B0H14DRAFT_2598238 [Mycena olivaceomarginata]